MGAHAGRFEAVFAWVFALGSASLAPAQNAPAADESDYYKVDFIPTPPGSVEVGGLDFLPDGRLVVSTRHGQVWIVSIVSQRPSPSVSFKRESSVLCSTQISPFTTARPSPS